MRTLQTRSTQLPPRTADGGAPTGWPTGSRYLIAEMIAPAAINTTEMSVAALISMVKVIFTIGTPPFWGQAHCRF